MGRLKPLWAGSYKALFHTHVHSMCRYCTSVQSHSYKIAISMAQLPAIQYAFDHNGLAFKYLAGDCYPILTNSHMSLVQTSFAHFEFTCSHLVLLHYRLAFSFPQHDCQWDTFEQGIIPASMSKAATTSATSRRRRAWTRLIREVEVQLRPTPNLHALTATYDFTHSFAQYLPNIPLRASSVLLRHLLLSVSPPRFLMTV